jgi:hypothetical protein
MLYIMQDTKLRRIISIHYINRRLRRRADMPHKTCLERTQYFGEKPAKSISAAFRRDNNKFFISSVCILHLMNLFHFISAHNIRQKN